MKSLTIISNITVKRTYVEEMKKELTKIVPLSSIENGCMLFELYQNNEDETHFKIIESWADNSFWQEHMRTEHIINFLISTSGMFDKFTTNQLKIIA